MVGHYNQYVNDGASVDALTEEQLVAFVQAVKDGDVQEQSGIELPAGPLTTVFNALVDVYSITETPATADEPVAFSTLNINENFIIEDGIVKFV